MPTTPVASLDDDDDDEPIRPRATPLGASGPIQLLSSTPLREAEAIYTAAVAEWDRASNVWVESSVQSDRAVRLEGQAVYEAARERYLNIHNTYRTIAASEQNRVRTMTLRRSERETKTRNEAARANLIVVTDEPTDTPYETPEEHAPAPVMPRPTGHARRPLADPNTGRLACGCYWDTPCLAGCNGTPRPRRRPALQKSLLHGTPFRLKKTAPGNTRQVGIEVEYNDLSDITPWITKWYGAIHRDGSCGWEAVTTPLAGGHIDACIRDLTRSLRKEGTIADERCGVHVHVDAHDITWPCMMRLLTAYARVEPLLYLMGGQHRIAEKWCKPCGQDYLDGIASGDAKEGVLSVAFRESLFGGKGKDYMNKRPGKKDGGRYKGFNIVPWLVGRRVSALDSTVEFRIHRNSLDARRIAGWAHVCAAIVEWSSKASKRDVDNLPKSALRALCIMAPDSKRWILGRIADWRRATSAEKLSVWSESGQKPKRRISVAKGVWSCVV